MSYQFVNLYKPSETLIGLPARKEIGVKVAQQVTGQKTKSSVCKWNLKVGGEINVVTDAINFNRENQKQKRKLLRK